MVRLQLPDHKADAKMELLNVVDQLVPKGIPDFPSIRYYPPIVQLIQDHGAARITKAILLLVKDFAASINVVRNINEDQAIEIAHMMVVECSTFRIEDYAMMFSMAKKGQIGKIFDHLDIQVISVMMDEYWAKRHKAGKAEQEKEYNDTADLGPSLRMIDGIPAEDRRLGDGLDGLAGALGSLKNQYQEWDKETILQINKNQQDGQTNQNIAGPDPTGRTGEGGA